METVSGGVGHVNLCACMRACMWWGCVEGMGVRGRSRDVAVRLVQVLGHPVEGV